MLVTPGTKSILGDCFIATSTVLACASAGAAATIPRPARPCVKARRLVVMRSLIAILALLNGRRNLVDQEVGNSARFKPQRICIVHLALADHDVGADFIVSDALRVLAVGEECRAGERTPAFPGGIAGQLVTPDRTPIFHAETIAQTRRIPLGHGYRAVLGTGFDKRKPV